MVGGVEGGMSDAIRQSRMKRSLLGTEGTGKSKRCMHICDYLIVISRLECRWCYQISRK